MSMMEAEVNPNPFVRIGLIKRTGVACTRSTGTYRVNFAKDFATKILSKDMIQHMVSGIWLSAL